MAEAQVDALRDLLLLVEERVRDGAQGAAVLTIAIAAVLRVGIGIGIGLRDAVVIRVGLLLLLAPRRPLVLLRRQTRRLGGLTVDKRHDRRQKDLGFRVHEVDEVALGHPHRESDLVGVRLNRNGHGRPVGAVQAHTAVLDRVLLPKVGSAFDDRKQQRAGVGRPRAIVHVELVHGRVAHHVAFDELAKVGEAALVPCVRHPADERVGKTDPILVAIKRVGYGVHLVRANLVGIPPRPLAARRCVHVVTHDREAARLTRLAVRGQKARLRDRDRVLCGAAIWRTRIDA